MIPQDKTKKMPSMAGFLYAAPQIETEDIQVPLQPPENEPDSDMVNITSDITDGQPYLYASDFGKYNHLYKDSSGNIYNYLGSKTKPYYKDQWLTPVTMSEFKQMRPKREIIGGTVEQSRVKMLQRVPNFTKEVYKKAQSYGIDPNLIFNRFVHEGFADQLIKKYNNLSYAEQKLFSEHPEYYLPLDGYGSLGLDYVGDELVNGLYDLKDSTATWQDHGTWEDNEGSDGFRSGAHAAMPDDLNSAIEMVAAALAYRQSLMQKRFKISGQDLNYYTNAAYNMGAYNKALNNADYIKTEYSYPDYYSKYALTYSDGGSLKTGNRAAYIAKLMAAAGYTAKDLSGMRTFARGGVTDSDDSVESDEPIYGGELAPAVVKPDPVYVDLETYPISRQYPITHSVLRSRSYSPLLQRNATPDDMNQHPVYISKMMGDPSYNLVMNNCSDDTGRFLGDAFHTNFISGITTPSGLRRKVTSYLDDKKIPYGEVETDDATYTTIPIPWYDYRKAVDNYNDEKTARYEQMAANESNDIYRNNFMQLAERFRDQPRLPYHLDNNGNVVNGRAVGGFIRRFDEGTPGAVIPVGDPRLLGGIGGSPTVQRTVPYNVQAPIAVEDIPVSVEAPSVPPPAAPVISDDERRRRIAILQSRGLTGAEDAGFLRQLPADATVVSTGRPDRSMQLDLNDEVHIPDRNNSEYFRNAAKQLYENSFPKLENVKGDDLTSLQRSMVEDGYYEKYLRGLSKDDIKKEQLRLVKRGLLSDERRSDGSYKEVDGIVGKKTIAAYNKSAADGMLGPRTKAAYEYKKEAEARPRQNSDLQFDKVVRGTKDHCARYVSDIFKASGADIKAAGLNGDAWTMPMSVVKHGGEVLFNLYANKAFSGVKTAEQLKATTRQELHNSNFNLRTLQVGDVVGIYFPGSRHHGDVLKSGSTYNTHIGMVRSIDRDGMPVIDHYVGGRRVDRADRLYGGGSITVAVRPDFARSSVPEYKFTSIPSTIALDMPEKFEKLSTPESKQNLSLYMDSLEGAKSPIGKIYKDADMDNVQRIAVSILGRETGFMQNTASNQDGLHSKISNASRAAAHSVLGTDPGAISSELTKFKLNSLTADEQAWLGIHSPDELNDPKKAARAVELLLAKNYDYFVRYSKANPSLNLTEQDIIDLTAASYNVGMQNLFNIGSTKVANRYIRDQARLDKFRAGAASDEPVDDIRSTNLGRLARLPVIGVGANILYDFGIGTRGNSYTNSNRQYMGLIRPVGTER